MKEGEEEDEDEERDDRMEMGLEIVFVGFISEPHLLAIMSARSERFPPESWRSSGLIFQPVNSNELSLLFY